MSFAIILLVGPGDQEARRAQDLLDSLVCHEGERVPEADIFLVNDGNEHLHLLDGALARFARCYHLQNPLAGPGHHPHHKLSAGMIRALSHAARSGPYRFVLKLDTDALAINPFYDQLVRFFGENPGVGIAGSYLRFPDGSPRLADLPWAARLEDSIRAYSLRPIVSRDPLRAPSALRRMLTRRRILEEARRQGYVDGHHVLGGSYAVSGAVLRPWAERSVHRLELLFRDVLIGEDVTVSLLVSWLGFGLKDFNAPDEVFGVWWLKLEAPPEALLQQYSIIHSVKSYEGQDEQEIRRIFRDHREAIEAAGQARRR